MTIFPFLSCQDFNNVVLRICNTCTINVFHITSENTTLVPLICQCGVILPQHCPNDNRTYFIIMATHKTFGKATKRYILDYRVW